MDLGKRELLKTARKTGLGLLTVVNVARYLTSCDFQQTGPDAVCENIITPKEWAGPSRDSDYIHLNAEHPYEWGTVGIETNGFDRWPEDPFWLDEWKRLGIEPVDFEKIRYRLNEGETCAKAHGIRNTNLYGVTIEITPTIIIYDYENGCPQYAWGTWGRNTKKIKAVFWFHWEENGTWTYDMPNLIDHEQLHYYGLEADDSSIVDCNNYHTTQQAIKSHYLSVNSF